MVAAENSSNIVDRLWNAAKGLISVKVQRIIKNNRIHDEHTFSLSESTMRYHAPLHVDHDSTYERYDDIILRRQMHDDALERQYERQVNLRRQQWSDNLNKTTTIVPKKILKQQLLSLNFEYQQIEDNNNQIMKKVLSLFRKKKANDYKSSIPLFYQVVLIGLVFIELRDWLNETEMGTNALLNVSKHFRGMKKEYFYWGLNLKYSKEYYSCLQFRDHISLLMITKKQLSLNFSNNSYISDVSSLYDVDKLNLSNCSNLTNVSMLGGLRVLNLSECRNLTDVSFLGRIHKLNLSHCIKVTDVSSLGHVHELDLSYCSDITDVSALRYVYDLDLTWCHDLINVSALSGTHKLNISHCLRVIDISDLNDVHDLRCLGLRLPGWRNGLHPPNPQPNEYRFLHAPIIS